MSVSVFFSKCSNRVDHNISSVTATIFCRINTCLFELIQCAGEESVALCRQIFTVKHPQQLMEVNYSSDKSKNIIMYVRYF
jgi:hypothetical protein